jgi:hypothetical protein
VSSSKIAIAQAYGTLLASFSPFYVRLEEEERNQGEGEGEGGGAGRGGMDEEGGMGWDGGGVEMEEEVGWEQELLDWFEVEEGERAEEGGMDRRKGESKIKRKEGVVKEKGGEEGGEERGEEGGEEGGEDVPEEFICPLSGDLLQDPIVASDGITSIPLFPLFPPLPFFLPPPTFPFSPFAFLPLLVPYRIFLSFLLPLLLSPLHTFPRLIPSPFPSFTTLPPPPSFPSTSFTLLLFFSKII